MSRVVTTSSGGNPFIDRAYRTENDEDLLALYEEWANTFNDDMIDIKNDYVAPGLVVKALFRNIAPGTKMLEVLDAGCGTGLAGILVAQQAAAANIEVAIDGVDLSPGMLDVARKAGVFRDLNTANLSKAMKMDDNKYDAIVCVGTLTHGHVGPVAIDEFVRVVKKGGHVVATVLGDIWESGGYEAEVKRLEQVNKARLISADLEDYRKGAGVKARMVVLEVL